jgi:transcriptional regulator with XRE-family HTH domain
MRLTRIAKREPIIKRMLDKAHEKADVGERLRKAMARADCSHTELAELTGVTLQAITGWLETGRIARKHYPTITKRLRITVDHLLTGSMLPGIPEIADDQHQVRSAAFVAESAASYERIASRFSAVALEVARLIDQCPIEHQARLVHVVRAEVDYILTSDAAKKKLPGGHKEVSNGSRSASRSHRGARKPAPTDA